MYSCGFKFTSALIWNQNPNFEIAFGLLFYKTLFGPVDGCGPVLCN